MANNEKVQSEAALTREEKLRRVVRLCCACTRNIGYYLGGWRIKTSGDGEQPVFSGEMAATINSNFLDIAVLEWCKLFGEANRDVHHWSRMFDTVEEKKLFQSGLLARLGCTNKEWKAFRNQVVDYRNKFLAHLDEKRIMTPPFLDMAVSSALYYHTFVLEHENKGLNYRGLPDDPDRYYRRCVKEGQRYYGRDRSTSKAA